MRTYLSRLMLVMQLMRLACQETESENVEPRRCRDAEAMVNYFKAHARRCYGLMGAPTSKKSRSCCAG